MEGDNRNNDVGEDHHHHLDKVMEIPHTSHTSLLRDMKGIKFDFHEIGDGEMVYALDSEEEREAFLEFVSFGGDHEVMMTSSVFWQLACLRARKFEAARALELLVRFEEWKKEHMIEERRVHKDELFAELLKEGVVIAMGNKDKTGRYMLTVRLGRINPERTTPRHAIVAIYFAIELLLVQYPESQSRGIVLCHDMSGATLSQFDTRTPKILMEAMSKALPVRFGGAYIMNAPWFMRMVFPVIRMFMSSKMRSRLKMLGSGFGKLRQYVDEDNIIEDMGGTFEPGDVDTYLQRINHIHTNMESFLESFHMPPPDVSEDGPSMPHFPPYDSNF
eukprot:m.132580 g.132580  ORF g.132580 m.132580 type:complete len:332 (+) comp9487_c0_seq9:705-1700(+)